MVVWASFRHANRCHQWGACGLPWRSHLSLLQRLSLPIACSPGPKRFLLACLCFLGLWTRLQLDDRIQLTPSSSHLQAWPVTLPALTLPADACSSTTGHHFYVLISFPDYLQAWLRCPC